ncbi:MAG: ABC transporter ATP-binding protein [Dehalococcoidia bacterium]
MSDARTDPAFLRCQGLVKRFARTGGRLAGAVTAVDGADLTVARGRTLALLGPSGCGKTTLLRLIAGFEAPDAGVVELGGRRLAGPGTWLAPQKRRVGLVFQDYALFPHLNVESNVAFGLANGRKRKQHVASLLSLVGLEGLGSRMPYELSGGQQQRVALARTLAAEPELVLLDEPFSNLDPGMRARVRAEVRTIIESLGTTAIFVTHDQEEALSLAAEVAVMLDGKVLQTGGPREMYERPTDRRVAEFLGDANFLSGQARDGYVECELGRIPSPLTEAGAVEVMVRPENLALSAETGEPAEIVSVEYYGHDQAVTVRLSGGATLRVRLMAGEEFSPGQSLGLSLRGEAVIFPR